MLNKNLKISFLTLTLAFVFMLSTNLFAGPPECRACAGPTGDQICDDVSIGSSWCLTIGGDCYDDLGSCEPE